MSTPAIRRRTFGSDVKDVTKYSISYKDVFSLDDFISRIHQWLEAEGYASGDEDFGEVYYLQRESPKSGKNVQMWWRVEKIPDEKKMYKFLIEIDITVRGLQKVEYMHNGQKAVADTGEVDIGVISRIQTDPEKHWEKNPIIKKYRKFVFDKWLKKGKAYEGDLNDEVIKLQDFIKEHLRISTSAPQHAARLWKTRPPN